MKQGRIINDNFKATIARSLDNTLNFENHTIFEKYNYEDEDKQVDSVLNLCLHNNYILDTLVPHLRNTSTLEVMSENDRDTYKRNPMKLSYHRYGIIDYWWILLAVNGYSSPYEFQDFEYLRIPTKTEIASIIDKEMFNNKQYGIMPE
jgi:hypothetical protein